MAEGNHFVRTCKDDIMISHNRSPSDCGNANLFVITLLMYLASVIYIMILVIHCFIQRICQCQSCTARCVTFQPVVLFYDLHVKSGCSQYFRRILQQLQQSIDTKRHICRLQNCHLFAAFLHLVQLFFCQTCGTQYQWELSFHTIIQHTVCCFEG